MLSDQPQPRAKTLKSLVRHFRRQLKSEQPDKPIRDVLRLLKEVDREIDEALSRTRRTH